MLLRHPEVVDTSVIGMPASDYDGESPRTHDIRGLGSDRPNLPSELCQGLRCGETFQVQEEGGCGPCRCDTEESFWEDFEKNIARTGEVRTPSAKVMGFCVGFIRKEVRSVNERDGWGKKDIGTEVMLVGVLETGAIPAW